MKHLKLFESKNAYYQSISENEFRDLMGYSRVGDEAPYATYGINCEKVSDKEMVILKKLLSTNREYVSFKFNKYLSSTQRTRMLEIDCRIGGDRVGYKLYTYAVEKVKDEWYLIIKFSANDNHQSYYKCDQLEGLIQFFRDNAMIKLY